MSADSRTAPRRTGLRATAGGGWALWLAGVVWLLAAGVADADAVGRGPHLRGAWLVDGMGVLGAVDPAASTDGSVDLDLLDAAGHRAQLGF